MRSSPCWERAAWEVYRARDARRDRTVAIKILASQFSADAAHKQRFDREAKIISNLNHPRICVLHDIGSQNGLDYLVMECAEGENLAKRLEKGSLPGIETTTVLETKEFAAQVEPSKVLKGKGGNLLGAPLLPLKILIFLLDGSRKSESWDYFRMAATGSTRDHFLQDDFLILSSGAHLDHFRIATIRPGKFCLLEFLTGPALS